MEFNESIFNSLMPMSKAPRWKFWAARLFGKKVDSLKMDAYIRIKVTIRKWRGHNYIESDVDWDYYN